MNAAERLEQYLVAQIADKERELERLSGEIAALHYTLATLRQFSADKGERK